MDVLFIPGLSDFRAIFVYARKAFQLWHRGKKLGLVLFGLGYNPPFFLEEDKHNQVYEKGKWILRSRHPLRSSLPNIIFASHDI